MQPSDVANLEGVDVSKCLRVQAALRLKTSRGFVRGHLDVSLVWNMPKVSRCTKQSVWLERLQLPPPSPAGSTQKRRAGARPLELLQRSLDAEALRWFQLHSSQTAMLVADLER